MVKILFSDPTKKFKQLNVAGDFSDWQIMPMVENVTNPGTWEFELTENMMPDGRTKVHFKFIDHESNWFTDEDYPKEIDEHDNENNVKMLHDVNGDEAISLLEEKVETARYEDLSGCEDGQLSPVPSLVANETESNTVPVENVTKEEELQNDNCKGGESSSEDATDSTISPPNSSSHAVTEKPPVDDYQGILATIIAFFTNLFRSTFG